MNIRHWHKWKRHGVDHYFCPTCLASCYLARSSCHYTLGEYAKQYGKRVFRDNLSLSSDFTTPMNDQNKDTDALQVLRRSVESLFDAGRDEWSTADAARELGIGEERVIIGFHLLENDGLVIHSHTLICPETRKVITVIEGKAANALPDSVSCPHHTGSSTNHRTADECFIEVRFSLRDSDKIRMLHNRAPLVERRCEGQGCLSYVELEQELELKRSALANAEASLAELQRNPAGKPVPRILKRPEDCRHKDFFASFNVARITDDGTVEGAVSAYYADISIKCLECETPFHFVGLPAGLSYRQPMCDPFAIELRAPIMPGRLAHPLQRSVFELKPEADLEIAGEQ